MKVALLITGHIRHGMHKDNYTQFINDQHETDVYVATWDNVNIDRHTHAIDHRHANAESVLMNTFGTALRGVWLGDFTKFMNFERPIDGQPIRKNWNYYISEETDPLRVAYPNPQRSMDQWYLVQRAYELVQESYMSYDVVIRIRADQRFSNKPPIPFTDIADGIHVNGYTWWTHPNDRENGTLADSTHLTPYAVSDQLAWGKPFWMLKYLNYYDHWPALWPGKLNVWHASPRELFDASNSFLYNTEHMMAYYLLKYPFYTKTPLASHETDMVVHRHGHDDNQHNRFDSDYYIWG